MAPSGRMEMLSDRERDREREMEREKERERERWRVSPGKSKEASRMWMTTTLWTLFCKPTPFPLSR